MGKYVLTITLNPALDVTMTVPGLGAGRTFGHVAQAISAGGKGINVARVLCRFGVPALAAGITAGKTGRLLKNLLAQEKIPSRLFITDGMTRINWTIIDPRDGSQARVLGRGTKLTDREITRFESTYARWLRHSSMVVLAGRNAYRAPEGLYARLIGLAKKRRVPVVVDTSGRPLSLALKAAPFMIKPNLQEAADVYGRRIESWAQIQNAVNWFHHFGVENVILSMGKRGAVASDGKEIWRVEAPRVSVQNDVGCGDALLAGFIHARLRGDPLDETLRWAVATGTANAMSLTPGAIRKSNVMRLFRRLSPRRIG